MKRRGQNLTNAQFPILIRPRIWPCTSGLSPRIRIENWELSIGQIDDHVPDIIRGCITTETQRHKKTFPFSPCLCGYFCFTVEKTSGDDHRSPKTMLTVNFFFCGASK